MADKSTPSYTQRRLFDPDNPPLAFPKENPELDRIRQEMRDYQLRRAQAHNMVKHGQK